MNKTFSVALLACFLAGAGMAQSIVPTLTVTGEGRASAAPDSATLSIGVTEQSEAPDTAMAGVSAKMETLIARLEAAGIAPSDMQTSTLMVRRDYEYDQGKRIELGFFAANELDLRIRDLSKMSDLLGALMADGANDVGDMHFRLEDASELRRQARIAAVENAREKAQDYAVAAGLDLGAILSISDSAAPLVTLPFPVQEAPVIVEEAASTGPTGVPISAGDVTAIGKVTIVWELVAPGAE
ncbi:SIMPL domain-containing protein [Mesobacterium pallidum]|uniref:SIMPL domain-containing protein n=1 Tax=Mesobacterium pallidum TaxID=2872037 RepID=UPI001EE2116C|nr:SIMPL domain-containing protein [Mesobacterium pallidum]